VIILAIFGILKSESSLNTKEILQRTIQIWFLFYIIIKLVVNFRKEIHMIWVWFSVNAVLKTQELYSRFQRSTFKTSTFFYIQRKSYSFEVAKTHTCIWWIC